MQSLFTLRSKRSIALTIGLTAVALWLNIWLNKTFENQQEPSVQSELNGLTWQATDTELWTLSQDGQQTYLHAKNVDYNQKTEEVSFIQLEAIHQNQQQITLLDANTGYFRNSKLLELQGDVHIEQPLATQLETQRLFADFEHNKAFTDQDVILKGKNSTTTATGLTYSTDTGRLELHQNVKSIIIPKDTQNP